MATDARWGSLEDLVEASGLSRRALQYVAKREPGVLVTRTRGGRVQYAIGSCNANLRRREREQAKRDAGEQADPSILDAERRKAVADARLAEVKLARLERTLVSTNEFVDEVEDLFVHVRSALLAHPKTRDFAEELLDGLRRKPPPERAA